VYGLLDLRAQETAKSLHIESVIPLPHGCSDVVLAVVVDGELRAEAPPDLIPFPQHHEGMR
jgi:hypothetical protein